MEIRTIYATGAATANAVQYIEFFKPGRIGLIDVSFSLDATADNSLAALELALNATAGQFSVNDARNVVYFQRVFASLVTSGLICNDYGKVFACNIPVAQGDRLYLHATVTTATYFFNARLHVF